MTAKDEGEATTSAAGEGPEDVGSPTPRRPGGLESLWRSLQSWRTASVVLLSFSSGMPLGLVWIAIPDWMRSEGVDIRLVGLFSLAQAPWTFNVLWAPLMDRFRLPFLGRRRGWALLAQLVLGLATLSLAGIGTVPDGPWVALALTLAIAFAAATQDIAVDAYAIDVLRRDEQGVAVGARIGMYRLGMQLAGAWSITFAAEWGWPAVCIGLGLAYLPMMAITTTAPEPARQFEDPKTLRDAIWLPFIGFLSRHRALEILVFVLLFKAGDNFAQALLRPFLNDMGYDALSRGGLLGTLSLVLVVAGSLVGSASTTVFGLGPSLWIFGLLQMFSNVGYVLIATQPVNLPLMFGAMSFENFTQGLGTGAFSVLLFRLTQRRFSATQYALFSPLFGLCRIVAGPVAAITVDAVGWANFFWLTIPLGIPGLVLLSRFVPWGVREPSFEVVERPDGSRPEPLGRAQLATRAVAGAAVGFVFATGLVALMATLKSLRSDPEAGWSFASHLVTLLTPGDIPGLLQLIGLGAFAVILGLVTAAVAAARAGAGRDLETG